MSNKEHYLLPSQLCIGLYVYLDTSWMRHPFALNNFKIKDHAQILAIQALNLDRIRYDPLRSDNEPLPHHATQYALYPADVGSIADARNANNDPHAERIKQLNQSIRACEKVFLCTTNKVRQILKTIILDPQAAVADASALIDFMVDSIMTRKEVIIHTIDGSRFGDETYSHPLNVTVLSLMLAKSIGITPEESHMLGMAALLHDAGKERDIHLARADSGMSTQQTEQLLWQRHCESGAELACQAGLSERVARIIMQHHERADGTGYPLGLKGSDIDPLASILALINAYDGLCNPIHFTDAMTPYAALSHLFANERKKYDAPMLNLLIKSLGVYPPGSIVTLSDGSYGLVISVNPQKLLRPLIMLHDRRVERETPTILDLSEHHDTSISKCLRLDQLPKDVAAYLQCRQHLSYFFSSTDLPDNNCEISFT